MKTNKLSSSLPEIKSKQNKNLHYIGEGITDRLLKKYQISKDLFPGEDRDKNNKKNNVA